jgi:ferric-dicitrate binding protein FerR (iron transport regulator)
MEPDIRTTLLEGSVRVEGLVLQPGQQARVHEGISLIKDPDIDQAMAWKRGLFDFDHASLQMVLRQLSRWYDIDVQFEGEGGIRTPL